MTQALARYAAVVVGVVVVGGVLLSLVFRGPGDALAIGISGVVALGVQLGAFTVSRMVGAGNLMARMGSGSLIRLFALVIYALLVVLVVKLSVVPALVSLATFFFVSTLLEPLLIKS